MTTQVLESQEQVSPTVFLSQVLSFPKPELLATSIKTSFRPQQYCFTGQVLESQVFSIPGTSFSWSIPITSTKFSKHFHSKRHSEIMFFTTELSHRLLFKNIQKPSAHNTGSRSKLSREDLAVPIFLLSAGPDIHLGLQSCKDFLKPVSFLSHCHYLPLIEIHSQVLAIWDFLQWWNVNAAKQWMFTIPCDEKP